ncbi:MAG TPA: hemolysin family protein [Rhodospirillales bacterium]|nr:hemolysin family protein [Rhodospirillales bacterium]
MNDESSTSSPRDDGVAQETFLTSTVRGWLRRLRGGRNGESSARDTLEELIEEREEVPLDKDEKRLLANVLDLRGCTVHDVMVPGADIVAVEASTSLAEVTQIMTQEGHSRLPVYRETLDDAMGMIHIKDVLAWRGDDKNFLPSRVLRQVLFVAPSMQVLELLLEMRVKRSHMALVVDEFGGVDGLVTIEDLVEEIIGEIEDEHDRTDEPQLIRHDDGTLDADARVPVETLEEIAGAILTDEEREDVETLGGLVAALAGRVPIRGELIAHGSGLEFEVVDADPRRVKRIKVRGLAPGIHE